MPAPLAHVVLDTNIIVSSFWGGLPRHVVEGWLAERYALLISPPVLAEYQATLERLLPHSQAVSRFLHAVYLKALSIHPKEELNVIHQDPADNRFLECALAGEADYIVSGDQHLLRLKSFRQIPILTARAFLEKLGLW